MKPLLRAKLLPRRASLARNHGFGRWQRRIRGHFRRADGAVGPDVYIDRLMTFCGRFGDMRISRERSWQRRRRGFRSFRGFHPASLHPALAFPKREPTPIRRRPKSHEEDAQYEARASALTHIDLLRRRFGRDVLQPRLTRQRNGERSFEHLHTDGLGQMGDKTGVASAQNIRFHSIAR